MFYELTRGELDGQPKKLPDHELYGYGFLKVGSVVSVDYRRAGVPRQKIQGGAHTYARYHDKKFETRKSLDGDRLIIKRIA